MKKIFKFIYIFIFLSIIIFVAGSMFKYEPHYLVYENRGTNIIPYEGIRAEVKNFFLNGAKPELEKSLKDYFYRDELVEADIFLNKYIFRRPFVGNVSIKSPHIYDFSENLTYSKDVDELATTVIRLNKFKEELEEDGKKFLVIPMPSISSRYDYPSYVLDPETIDGLRREELYNLLKYYNIDYIPAYDYLSYEDFFATDHHFGMSGALKIIDEIKKYFIDGGIPFNDADYQFKEHSFKGSRSKMLANLTESEPIYEPIYSMSFTRTGDYIDYINDFDGVGGYVAYMSGDHFNTFVSNDSVEDGADILIYGDSFTNIIESVIIQNVKSMESYDFRYSPEDFKKNVDVDAEVVILIADEKSFRTKEEYIFFRE